MSVSRSPVAELGTTLCAVQRASRLSIFASVLLISLSSSASHLVTAILFCSGLKDLKVLPFLTDRPNLLLRFQPPLELGMMGCNSLGMPLVGLPVEVEGIKSHPN